MTAKIIPFPKHRIVRQPPLIPCYKSLVDEVRAILDHAMPIPEPKPKRRTRAKKPKGGKP